MIHHSRFVFPEMAFVRQHLFTSAIQKTGDAVRASLNTIPLKGRAGNNGTVAVAVGSRRIDNLHVVVDQCLRFLEERGFQPFIVPAMGSHGGGTADGQKAVLAKFRISETTMHVPVIGDMETREVATHPLGFKIFISRPVLEADHLVLINRIKPHTKFKADIESGLCKMMSIGLGKVQGASEFHRYAINHGFGLIESAAKILLKKLNVLFGLGLLEDGYGKLAAVEAVLPDHLIDREKALLKRAAFMMGTIPFDLLDILIVDYFGKDISGIGMDSNVTGRHRDLVGDIKAAPNVKRIFVRELSPGSDGNANGIGLADVTTSRLVERMDIKKTYMNSVTAISPEKAAIPLHFKTDRECLNVCAHTTGISEYNNLRVVRIKDTASLACLQISKPLEAEALKNDCLSMASPWQKLEFDKSGNLVQFFPKMDMNDGASGVSRLASLK